MLHFTISESGTRRDVVNKLTKSYGAPMHPVVTKLAASIAETLSNQVPDPFQPVSIHIAGHVEVQPKSYG